VGRYQKVKTNLDFSEARDSEWQWHQLGHMQVCTSLQADNHASTPPLSQAAPLKKPVHDHPDGTLRPHTKFGQDPLQTVSVNELLKKRNTDGHTESPL